MKSIFYLVVSITTLGIAMLGQRGQVAGQEPLRPVATLTSVFPVSGPPRQYELVQQILEFPPGGATREHTHGGPAFVTVIEGQSTITEGSTEKVYGPGQTYTEAEGVAITASNRTNSRTRVLASFLLSPGAVQTLNRPYSPAPPVPAVTTFISRTTLGTQPAEFEVRQVVNRFAPGAVLPLHTHGGPALAMVIEGEVTFDVGDVQQKRTAGGFFEENDTKLVHQVRNTGAGPATVVITFLIPQGAAMTTFVTPSSPPAPASPPLSTVAIRPPPTGDGGLASDQTETVLNSLYIGSLSGLVLVIVAKGVQMAHRRRQV
jgi:quercetin dioxygenase-like cupin family protein